MLLGGLTVLNCHLQRTAAKNKLHLQAEKIYTTKKGYIIVFITIININKTNHNMAKKKRMNHENKEESM